MNFFIYQVKQAYLSLMRTPGFVFSIVTTMGITLGALLCVLTLAYVMLIKPLPYPDQERLFNVEHQLVNNGDVDGNAFTYPNLMYLYKNQAIFEKSALVYYDGAVITSLATEPMAEISYVTPQWFELLATKMAKGRPFQTSEKLNSYHPVALISFSMWQQEFNGAENILDQRISLAGTTFKIIGVVAEDNVELPLAGASFNTKVYLPWDFNSVNERDRKAWGNDDGGLMFIGKLKPDLINQQSAAQRNLQLSKLVDNNWQEQIGSHQFFKGWSININAVPLKSYIIADGEQSVFLLLIGALGLVAIACANIANLLISRTAERQQHLAVNAAVGASQKHLFIGILVEIGVLMIMSIIVAQLITYFGFSTLHYFLGDYLPRINELGLNYFSFTTSLVVLVLITLLFSVLCRNMVNYRRLNTALLSSGKGSGVQVSKPLRKILIVSQITIATSLIFINLVLYKDASNLVNQPLGYDTENRHAVVLALPNIERKLNIESMNELKQRLRDNPKIAQVSQAMRPSGFGTFALTTQSDNKRYSISGKDVDDQYFSLIDQPIVEGDNFTQAQVKDRELVAIVNDVLAKKLAPNGSAIGTKFTNGAKVIGVVKAIKVPGSATEGPRFYYTASPARNMLLIKLHDGQTLSRVELIAILKSVNSQLSLFSYSSLDEYKNRRLFSATTTAITTITLTIITFLLSGLGLYGILKYSSQMRRYEIGTRLAIGAKGKDIIALIIKDNSSSLLTGIVISLLALLTLYLSFSDSLVSYISMSLVPLFLATLLIIAILSFVACYLPLRHYIKQPAMRSLRGSE